ncbi:hypothetical protein SAMN02910298_01037 [Pseudobutyrivibrio sp. YE44]|uniref:DUF6273 domain-containing protein n=1 Tax=Pseudobutyrivibrio sp. YE44 TaxID=1520802 RepID=UPI00087E5F26|nr:DUF6273 domain-containing protein [Pseudobutyrivibrio sp. YE44]SDB21650.1 hypothetical protein SAMN02910298_01037 [Pseudobutyrivibrio sp. YE44]
MKKQIKILKRLFSVSMAILSGFLLLYNPITSEAASSKSKDATYAVGDDITMGRLDGILLNWTILKYDDKTKTAYVIARKSISSISITNYRKSISNLYTTSGTTAGYVRWSDNFWRGWCNEIFYKQSFNEAERAMIVKTTSTEQDGKNCLLNYYHDTKLDAAYLSGKAKNPLSTAVYNSQTTTADYIFFMSADEFREYRDNIKTVDSFGYWSLRTNAHDDPVMGLFVKDSDKLIYRDYYYGGDSIRPAMTVKLGQTDDEKKAAEEATSSSSTDSKDTKTSDTKSSETKTSTTTSKTTTTSTTQSTTKTATKKKSYANNGTNIGNVMLPDESFIALSTGATAQTAINMAYLNSSEKDYTVTYTSSNAGVFTVDSKGIITATGKGTATLSVRMKKSNGKVYNMSCRVDVT